MRTARALTGGVVVPLTTEGFDRDFYAEQIQNDLEAQGRSCSDRTANRLADQLLELIQSGKPYVVSRSWMVTKQEITIAPTAKEAEGTIDWSKVEEDWDPWGLEVYEGTEIDGAADPVHQVDY